MINHLKKLDAYVCVSKVYGRPLPGFDSTVEGDISRLKKGIRYKDNLAWHEAYYIALDRVGQLDHFVTLADAVQITGNDFTRNIKMAGISAVNYRKNAEDCEHTNEKRSISYMEISNSWAKAEEAYKILNNLSADAEQILKGLKKNKSGLIDWKDLTSVQFYKYDGAANRFFEFDHRK